MTVLGRIKIRVRAGYIDPTVVGMVGLYGSYMLKWTDIVNSDKLAVSSGEKDVCLGSDGYLKN